MAHTVLPRLSVLYLEKTRVDHLSINRTKPIILLFHLSGKCFKNLDSHFQLLIKALIKSVLISSENI